MWGTLGAENHRRRAASSGILISMLNSMVPPSLDVASLANVADGPGWSSGILRID
jgi:hypothetical protein